MKDVTLLLIALALLGPAAVDGVPLDRGVKRGVLKTNTDQESVLLPGENALKHGETLESLEEKWATWSEMKQAVQNFGSNTLNPLFNRVSNAASGNNYYQSKAVVLKAADLAAIIYFKESEVSDGASFNGRHMRGLTELGLTKVVYFNDPKFDAEMVLARPAGDGAKHDPVFLVFAGTESTQDELQDAKVAPVDFRPYSAGKVHQGFFEQFAATRPVYYPKIEELVRAGYDNFVIAGHSLGGSVATLAAAELANKMTGITVSCITFGAAKPGDLDFVANFNAKVGANSARFVDNNDPVPCLVDGFFHVDHLVQYVTAEKKWYEDTRQTACALATAAGDHSCVPYMDHLRDLPEDHRQGCKEVWDQGCYWTGCYPGGCPTGTKEVDHKSCWNFANSENCCKSRMVCQ